MLTFAPGFFFSALVFYSLNLLFPIHDMDQIDDVDIYGTFTAAEARRVGVAPLDADSINGQVVERRSSDNIVFVEDGKGI